VVLAPSSRSRDGMQAGTAIFFRDFLKNSLAKLAARP
jgi:hypothetical protein